MPSASEIFGGRLGRKAGEPPPPNERGCNWNAFCIYLQSVWSAFANEQKFNPYYAG